jgi:hypothetical protein
VVEVMHLREFLQITSDANDWRSAVCARGTSNCPRNIGAVEVGEFVFHGDQIELNLAGGISQGFRPIDCGNGAAPKFLKVSLHDQLRDRMILAY